MTQMTFLDFFSGIGGFRKGFELCGMRCVGHCEIDKYATLRKPCNSSPPSPQRTQRPERLTGSLKS